MTWLKKVNPDWNPQEHPGLLVGDHIDFPGPYHKLLEEGNAVLCDADGNEVSTYDATGILTDKEMQEFKAWRAMQGQEALKKTLESEREELLAQAEAIKTQSAPATTPEPTGTVDDAKAELEVKKREFAAKMQAAKAAKKAAAEQPGTEATA